MVDESVEIDIELVEDRNLFIFVGQVEADHWIAALEPIIRWKVPAVKSWNTHFLMLFGLF